MKDEIITHLLMYLQNMIDSGQHKLFYDDLMSDEKVIDIINAITNLQEENKHLDRVNCQLRKNINNNVYKSRIDKAIEILEQDKASASFNTAERIAINILKGE